MPVLNPFLYGRPVPPRRFVGRALAVRTIFSRLMNGDSTAVVGEPHIGKSSLLGYVADEGIKSEWLGAAGSRFYVHHVDCHLASSELRPEEFWAQVLASAPLSTLSSEVGTQLTKAAARQFSSSDLFKLFTLIAAQDCRIIVLIDEFDTLLVHPEFVETFFATLRSIATRSDGLCYITASRLTVSQMNRLGSERLPLGSPLFNNVVEVRLNPLSSVEVRQLLDMSLAGTSVSFNDADHEFIEGISGRHPFLVQLAAASLFDASTDTQYGHRYEHAAGLFAERADAHYAHLWRTLPLPQRRLLQSIATPRQGDLSDADGSDASSRLSDIRDLDEMGLIARRENGDAETGADVQWAVSSKGLEAWLAAHGADPPTADGLRLDSHDKSTSDDPSSETELRARLYKILLEAYPDRADLNRLLWLNLGKPLNEIAGSEGNQSDVVVEVLVWAIAEGRIIELLRAAVGERPSRSDLAALLDEAIQLNM